MAGLHVLLAALGWAAFLTCFAWAWRAWPFAPAEPELAPPSPSASTPSWKTLALLAPPALYALGLGLWVEAANVAAEGYLPREPHPRGWRRELDPELFPLPALTPALTPAELAAARARAARINELHDRAERALQIYALVPLGVLVLVALCLSERATWRLRLGAAPLLLVLLAAAAIAERLQLYQGLDGD